ncbi:MAG: hypothetical protein ACLUD8_04585 [Clostridium sp.]
MFPYFAKLMLKERTGDAVKKLTVGYVQITATLYQRGDEGSGDCRSGDRGFDYRVL